MLPLEAVADAIMHEEGFLPGKPATRNRNPGNLRDSPYKIGESPDGFAVFPDLPTGYHALMHLLELYFSGQNSLGIGPQSTLEQMFDRYAPAKDRNVPLKYAQDVAWWISIALNRSYTAQSKLGDICPVTDPSIPVKP